MTWTISPARKDELATLVEIWERSVRATHDFLSPEDIDYYRPMVRDALPMITVLTLRNAGGGISGFAGVSERKLEMLFLEPSSRGKGGGRLLADHAIRHFDVDRVDVNEQNLFARAFYERIGFQIRGRSAVDSAGRPYPILHMSL